MKTHLNPQMAVFATLHGAGVSHAPERAAEAINAPLKDLAGLPEKRPVARGQKTACHPSRFEARRNSGQFKGGLNGFNCEFFGVEVFPSTGREQNG
jgi:hypothetical protein